MTQIEFEPTLEHCIQTLARQEYDRIMRRLLETGEKDEVLGERLLMLKDFLESADFNRLRSSYEPYLTEGKKAIFRLSPGENGTEYQLEIK
ncbi:MAG: hypothetical protein R6U37_01915 [Dehalococcoidia bacterium]